MSTSAPQMPVKIITALWFSILAAGFFPNPKPEIKGEDKTCVQRRTVTG